ncbi:phage head-tail joining protein [Azotobacter salinestris]|uniref:phage head-tail joining protein n=1 Tax=Azotobacter salinestris TaxID=69964 RepID=UPI0032DF26EC
MAYTLEQYAALQAAIAEGALTVRYQDKSVQYRSLDEMMRILKLMATELGLNSNNDGGRRYASFSKGY